ncbi:MAG: alkaline phosphatase family protein [SAR202 cluster bacterium]|nr:alkaline phosphatase family protein [SAR202 cluster bacterium]|tara:strand:- start:23622 stop:25040 length:1419 start_codon:yes stop_codon:yes gene_type:complete
MTAVLIVAFDGLQPSQIDPHSMPVLSKFADSGVRFSHNHSVFPSVTRTNAATIVTGVGPGKHGLTANKSMFPEYSSTQVVDALHPTLSEINQHTKGKLLFVPTIGEIIRNHNLQWVSVVGGTSGNAYIQHPKAAENGHVVIHPEFTDPTIHSDKIKSQYGDWPSKKAPAADLIRRTADVAIGYALTELNPDVLMIWFPEPDTSQHAFGVNSPEARRMIELADRELGRIFKRVSLQGFEPDVFIVSDHGYSTIDSVIDVGKELRAGGFNIGIEENSVIAADNGGSVLFYVPGADSKLSARLLHWLSGQRWVGSIATDIPNDGTAKFASLSDVGLAGPRAPLIVVTMRSSVSGEVAPLASLSASTGGVVGLGSHGGGNSAELHNTLIVGGPSFKSDYRSKIPSGNIDIAPTILHLLDIPVPAHFDGRILREALQVTDIETVNKSHSLMCKSSKSKTVSISKARYLHTEYMCQFG